MQICKLFKLTEHNQAIIAVAHVFPDLPPPGWCVVIFILIGQAVLISAFSFTTGDAVLFARRVFSPAIRTLVFINKDRLALSGSYCRFCHKVL